MMTLFFRSLPAVIILLIASVAAVVGQPAATKKSDAEKAAVSTIAGSPAFAELLLKKTELQSNLESLVLEYTEEYPKVKELRFVLGLMDRDIARIAKVKPADSGKLTLALGKLMVRRIELETDLWNLQRSYKDEHPEVKRAKRKVEIYEAAISEILN
jgi:uncharacterized protein involved in exopolysaccharide biosynthesis